MSAVVHVIEERQGAPERIDMIEERIELCRRLVTLSDWQLAYAKANAGSETLRRAYRAEELRREAFRRR